MKIFFDVDYTILGLDDSLRPGTIETLTQLKEEGNEIYKPIGDPLPANPPTSLVIPCAGH